MRYLPACWLWQESSLPGKIKRTGQMEQNGKRAFHEKKFQRPCGLHFCWSPYRWELMFLVWQRIWMTPFMWQQQPRPWRRTGCSRTMPILECWHRIFRRDMCLHPFRSCLHSTVIWCICMRRLWHIRSNRSSFF